jgi:Holliday junction resolvase
MKESILQGRIKAYLINDGWEVVKLILTSKPGIPDLMCLKNGKIIFIEVKQPNGKLSKLQEYMINKLITIGFDTYVIRSVEQIKTIINEKYS